MNKIFAENIANTLMNMPFAAAKKELRKNGFHWAANDDAYDYEGTRARQVEFWYGDREISIILIVKVGGTREVMDLFDVIDWAEWIASLEALIEKAKA